MTASPVCTFDGTHWVPGPLAKGPFPGLHGGVVGGLLAAEMEKTSHENGGGMGLQMSLSLLRPTPMEPVAISVRTLRQGRRSLQLSSELVADGKTCADRRQGGGQYDVAEHRDAVCPKRLDCANQHLGRLSHAVHRIEYDGKERTEKGKRYTDTEPKCEKCKHGTERYSTGCTFIPHGKIHNEEHGENKGRKSECGE